VRALQLSIAAAIVVASGCKKPSDPGPDLQIVGETGRLRSGEPVPRTSPWFDGTRVTLVAARGETLGIQVLHRGGGAVTVTLPAATVQGYAVDRAIVVRASSDMYGNDIGGPGDYPDGLTPTTAPATDPAYFTIAVPSDLAPGHYAGELEVVPLRGGSAPARRVPIDLEVAPVTLPALPLAAWAEYNPKEIGGTTDEPSAAERQCIALFRERGVLLAPPTTAVGFRARKDFRCCKLSGASKSNPYLPSIWARMKVESAMRSASSAM
jgi:hypothetical protein